MYSAHPTVGYKHLLLRFKNRCGSSLVCKEGCSFPWGGARGSLTAHFHLQSATLLSQYYHYLRWPNLHVRRSVTFNLLFIKFISAFYHVCVTG
jgi:hypothetical protein